MTEPQAAPPAPSPACRRTALGEPSSKITARQRQVLDFIELQMRERGYPPSVREIGDAVGLTSPSTRHLAPSSAPPARAAASRRRLEARYRRRRAVVGLLLAGVVGGAALVADSVLTGPGGVPASAAGTGTAPARSGMVVRAAAGDSLWSIATAHHGRASITRYVEALIDLNGGTVIRVGQLVRLP